MRSFSGSNAQPQGRSILVTGGTGSFGKRFIKTVVERHSPRRLIVYSRDELKQYEMANDPVLKDCSALRFFIGDVRDQARLEMAMRDIEIVVHAAALKHVPTAEYNPFECIHTNVLGAENVVQAALRCGVQQVLALSTDKAASPINLYGASKLASDKILVAANNLSGSIGTRFSVVRYGNVFGSRGSVIPYFKGLVKSGADFLPITDPQMTRFWITLQQGVDFVLSTLSLMHGGEIFVPKIPSMKITDLARAVAPDLAHEIVGIRSGEKLHETLITEDDARYTVEFEDRYAIEPSAVYWQRELLSKVGGKAVDQSFSYTSTGNPEWLSKTALRELLNAEIDV